MSDKASDVDETLRQRGERYGTFVTHGELSQKLKRVVQSHRGWSRCDNAQKEALDMILHKIARILNGDPNYVDSWHDIAGYATLVEKNLNGESV